ncbi:MAG: FliM/FliN family flagellar motor switch protein [Sandaracinaceae bacterium]|nr:FliM/FliN family flagellar motor switch protein [Sandaracinaceae bacterium]
MSGENDDAPGLDPAALDALEAGQLGAEGLDDAPGLDPAALDALNSGALADGSFGGSLGAGGGLDDGGLDAGGLDAGGLDAGALGADEAPGLDLAALERAQGMGDGPLLSAEESAALFDAIRNGAVEAHATRPASLGSADEPMRRAQKRLDDLAPSAANDLREALLRAGTVPESVDPSACEVVPLEAFSKAVPPAAAVWTIRSAGEAVARVMLEPVLVAALLERRLGANDALVGARPIERAPSSLELRVLEPIARAAADKLVAPFVPGPLVYGPPGRPSELGSPLAPCAMVTLALTPRRGSPAEIKIALFAASLGHTSAPTKLGVRMGDVISDVEVEVVAVLGRTASTVRALLALERGSVLRLDGAPDRPIEVRVDGVTVLRGMPVVKDGNLAIEVNP